MACLHNSSNPCYCYGVGCRHSLAILVFGKPPVCQVVDSLNVLPPARNRPPSHARNRPPSHARNRPPSPYVRSVHEQLCTVDGGPMTFFLQQRWLYSAASIALKNIMIVTTRRKWCNYVFWYIGRPFGFISCLHLKEGPWIPHCSS